MSNYTSGKSATITPHDDGRCYVELLVNDSVVRYANFATWRGAQRVVDKFMKW